MKLYRVIAGVCALTMLFGMTACASKTNDDDKPSDGGNEMTGFVPREKQEMPTAEIVDKDYDYGDPSTWAGDELTSLDLGHVYLQDVIEDDVYDWGHSVIKEGDTYRMWWCRPGFYDAIFYAESKDLKNWVNVQRVICLSPNQGNIKKFENIKGMLGKPSVIKVDGTYYMYFEAPASEDISPSATVKEWDNQVMLATSKDGIDWTFYTDENGEPTPVIAMPADKMGDVNNKPYGVGQPSVFYKDGKFYLTYCYVIDGPNEIRVAISEDPYNFGDPSTHEKISVDNGRGVTYNTKTNKYMIIADEYGIVESDTLNFINGEEQPFMDINANEKTVSFFEFVKNEHGLVDTETFYIIHQYGEKSPDPNDWRVGHQTWDGYIHAVNPRAFANRTITLPNGAAATEANKAGYRDRSNRYTLPEGEAVYAQDSEVKIDGEKDALYDEATKIMITRPCYDYGSNFTDSWGEAWVLWNEEYLYVYANVYDRTPNTEYVKTKDEESYMHDSLDIFVDTPNNHTEDNQPFGVEQYCISADSNRDPLVIKMMNEWNITEDFPASARRYSSKTTDFGYTVEVRVTWYEFALPYVQENAVIGMDFQVNDAMGNEYYMDKPIGREAIVAWSDHTGNAFRYVDRFGDMKLIKK